MLSKSSPKINLEPRGIVSRDVKSYGNDPYFQKKAADSKAFLEKHGFPEEVKRRMNRES